MRQIVPIMLFLCLSFLSAKAASADTELRKIVFQNQPVITSPCIQNFKPWNKSERELISGYFENIHALNPNFIKSAVRDEPLLVFRASRMNSESDVSTSPLALTSVEGIAFFDVFFERDSSLQQSTVAHELTHVVDFGNYISYSKEWVNYVSSLSDDQLFKLVSHGSSSLSESLADSMSACVLAGYLPEAERFNKEIQPFFSNPTRKQIAYSQHMRRASKLERVGDWKAAIKEYRHCVVSEDCSIFPLICIMSIESSRKQFDDAFRTANMFYKNVKTQKLPFTDNLIVKALENLVVLRALHHKEEDSIAILDIILSNDPDDIVALKCRNYFINGRFAQK